MTKASALTLTLTRLALTMAGAILFASLPFSVSLDTTGRPHLQAAVAFADEDDESDDAEESDDDSEDDEEEDDDGDDDDDDDGDDSSGGSSGSGPNGGEGGEGGATGPSSDCDGSAGPEGGCAPPDGPITRVEVSRAGIEIRYADGARESIQRGRYEIHNAQGRLVSARRATGADIARLRVIAQNTTIDSVAVEDQGAPVRRRSASGGDTEVRYSNGWTERISDGRYELIDPYGRSVVRRPATGEDRARIASGA